MKEETSPTLREEARRLIGECLLFRGLAEAKRADLIARSHIRTYTSGETLFLMGDEGYCLMAVLKGRILVSVTSSDGREMVLALLGPGEILGEIAVLDGRERTADAKAHSACTVAVVDRRDLITLLERDSGAWRSLVELLCARLRSTDQHIAEIALLDLPGRLANVLLRLTEEQAGKSTEHQLTISQRQLGEMVGASRESVNKCLSQWQRRGLVRVDGTKIHVINRSALRRAAEPD